MQCEITVIKSTETLKTSQFRTSPEVQFVREITGEKIPAEFNKNTSTLIVNGETFKVVEVSSEYIQIKNETVLTARFMTYKDGKQHNHYVTGDVSDFWDKFDAENWGKKVFCGYIAK